MCAIHTNVVKPAHGHARTKTPWKIDDMCMPSCGRLVRYISGGGMRTFGRTVKQEEARLRQNGFLVVAAVIAVLWFLFLVF